MVSCTALKLGEVWNPKSNVAFLIIDDSWSNASWLFFREQADITYLIDVSGKILLFHDLPKAQHEEHTTDCSDRNYRLERYRLLLNSKIVRYFASMQNIEYSSSKHDGDGVQWRKLKGNMIKTMIIPPLVELSRKADNIYNKNKEEWRESHSLMNTDTDVNRFW